MKRLILTLSGCALMWGTGAAAAPGSQTQNDGRNQASQQASQQAQQQRGERQAQSQRFRGELTGLRTIDLRNERQKHVLAKLRTQRGDTVVLDLGPADDLRRQNVRFQRGQQIEAQGYPARIDDNPVVAVHRLNTGQRQLDLAGLPGQRQQTTAQDRRQRDQRQQAIAQDRRQRDQRQQPGQRQQEITATGTLDGYRTVELSNQREKHVLGRVRTDQGQTLVVDLGPVSELRRQQVDLQRGMDIRTRGAAGRINEKPVLMVYTFELDGQRYGVGQQRGGQQTMRDQQTRQMDRRQAQRTDRRQMAQQQAGRQQTRQQGRQQRDQQGRQQAGQQTRWVLIGSLEDMRQVNLRGVQDQHSLVKVDSVHGQSVVVDLGRKQDVQGLQLQQGDQVVIAGQPARINNRPVLLAQQVAEIESISRTR